MIDVLKTLLAAVPDIGWRAQFNAVASLGSSALAPLFVVSSRPAIHTGLDRQPATHVPNPEPRPTGAHWRQIAQEIEDYVRTVRTAAEYQAAALVQVDAADFTVASIIDDLTAVMPHAAELRVRPSRPVLVPQHALAA